MKRIAIITALALSVAACGHQQPVVTNGDITKHLEGQGYTKVLLRDKFSCGSMGQGKHFIGTNKSGKVVTGQVCYKKANGNVSYKVDELTSKGASNDNSKRFGGINNPWK